ncbi:MAG TPA: CHAT domain-containing protein, partial [Ktedonobacterales bacterium]
MRYLDFDLEIGPGSAGNYPIAVRSPAGQAQETIHFPFDEPTLEKHLLKLQIALLQSAAAVRQVLSPEQQLVQDFGQQLFDAIISGEVRSRYDVCRQMANQQSGEMGVRLRWQVQAPELAALPWEFLYDARQGEYVCLSRFTPLVRYLDLPQPTQPLTIAPPLRILCMIASPGDQATLDIPREKRRIADALKALETQGLVELHWLAGQTWNDLHEAMWRGPWHIFHFIGHGGFDPNAQEGLLALAGEQGQTQLLSATQLTRLLADHRSLRLALLNACEGARSGEKDIFSSTAATLAHGGIPAVLAMQHAITDRAAIQLTRTFYSALANGLPVDQAVSEVRKAISVDTPRSLEWGTPVLYLRSPDGILFKLAAAAPPAAAPVPPSPPPYAPTLAVPAVAPAAIRPSGPPESTFFVATGKTREQWVEEGITYARTGRFQEAVAAYEAAIRLAPGFALAHFGKGDTLRLLNRPEEALAALDQAIQLDPAMAAAHRRKGYVLNQLKRY